MMVNSSCVAGCLDAQNQVKLSLVKLHQWAEADAEFLRTVSMSKEKESSCYSNFERTPSQKSFACRQRYLRSYTFSKKETVAQKTTKWLQKEKKKKNSKAEISNDRPASGSCTIIQAVLKVLLLCVAKVDVHEEGPASGFARKTSAVTPV